MLAHYLVKPSTVSATFVIGAPVPLQLKKKAVEQWLLLKRHKEEEQILQKEMLAMVKSLRRQQLNLSEKINQIDAVLSTGRGKNMMSLWQ